MFHCCRYKFEEGNFHINIPASTAQQDPATIVLPEKLVQVQAYLRWERNGKQQYSQEKEKVSEAVNLLVFPGAASHYLRSCCVLNCMASSTT